MNDTPHDDDAAAALDDLTDDELDAAADEAVPAGEQIDRTVEAMLTNSHRSAELLLAAKRAERAAINAEIRQLVTAEDKARRALHVYRKAAAK